MGMSAGQARLLSITAKLTDNELRSQMLTNSKLRLADKSTEASNKYMDALNSQQLMYTSYDGSGNKLSEALTANTILTFADLKNQYAMVNTSGQILLAGNDIKIFEASDTLADYLYSYGIAKTDNPKYIEELKVIYGENYTTIYDEENILGVYNDVYNTVNSKLSEFASFDWTDPQAANSFNTLVDAYNGTSGVLTEYIDKVGNSGINLSYQTEFSNLLNTLNSVPEPPEPPSLLDFAQALLSPQCWTSTGIDNLRTDTSYTSSNTDIWHMEHVLAQYLWSQNSSDPNYSEGGNITVNTANGTETITNGNITNDSDMFGLSDGGGNGNDPMKVRDVLKKPENAELKTKLEQLYYQVALHIETNGTQGGLTSGSVTNNNSNTLLSNEEIGRQYLELINELVVAVATDVLNSPEDDSRRAQLDINGYNTAMREYYSNYNSELTDWVEYCTSMLDNFKEHLENLPARLVPDENDSKYQWYKNLWYRMGGINEKEKDDSGRHYKELDPNLLNNAEWLEFAFEHGIVTLEQAQYTEKGSAVYPNMGNYDWTSIIYTSAADIVSVEDEAAIARAEVEYENTVRDIENEDKKIDQDLKKLDTEHNALQTEYDSIKSVIDKNVERSFKAFS